MARRRSRFGLVLAGMVVIVAGFGVALVEVFRLPKGSIWLVVAATIVLVTAIRHFTRPR